jgi:rod shape-determining protein MreB and related proteins
MSLFKRPSFYIKIYFNAIEVTHLDTGETIKRSSLEKFSTKRLVIADFNIVELLVRNTIDEFEISKGIIKKAFHALVQQMEIFEDGISEIEKRAMRDIAYQAGAVKVNLNFDTKKLPYEEAFTKLKNKEFPY